MGFIGIPLLAGMFAAGIIYLQNRTQRNTGGSWAVAMVVSILILLWTIYLHFVPDSSVTFGVPNQAAGLDLAFVFRLDANSWPYLMALSLLLVVTMITAPSRLEPETPPTSWAVCILIILAGCLAVSSGGIWPLIYCWMGFDILDMVFMFNSSKPKGIKPALILSVGIRFLGTFMAAISLAVDLVPSEPIENEIANPLPSMILLLACALRLGIVPIQQPYDELPRAQFDVGLVLHIVSSVTVLPILSRLPLSELDNDLAVFFSIFAGVASLIGAFGWITSPNAAKGSSYYTIAIAGMSYACALRGEPQAAIIWGVSLVMSGTPLFLFFFHNRWLNILPLISILLFSGIPYSPNAAGWYGLIAYPFSLMDSFYILSQILIITGGLRHILKQGTSDYGQIDPWMRSIYPLGIVTAIVVHFLTIWLMDGFSMGIWLISVPTLIASILLWLLIWAGEHGRIGGSVFPWMALAFQKIWLFLQRFLSLNWMIRIGAFFLMIVRSATSFLSSILEGQGGILWELLLLAMFVTVLIGGAL